MPRMSIIGQKSNTLVSWTSYVHTDTYMTHLDSQLFACSFWAINGNSFLLVPDRATLLVKSHFFAQNFGKFNRKRWNIDLILTSMSPHEWFYSVKSTLRKVRIAPAWATNVKFFAPWYCGIMVWLVTELCMDVKFNLGIWVQRYSNKFHVVTFCYWIIPAPVQDSDYGLSFVQFCSYKEQKN